tara:strand:+ start:354 stop:965 length:612 start_codon:yes stop_codon:yes gene_type:complete
MSLTFDGSTNTISGLVINSTNITDGSIVNADINASAAIASTKLSGITSGITMYDQWRFTASPSVNQTPLSGSWERNDTNFDKIGTGMSVSSGVFTFPTTGIYQIFYQINFYTQSSTNYVGAYCQLSTDGGSNYTQFAYSYDQFASVSGYHYGCAEGNVGIDVTNTSNFKFTIHANGGSPTNANVQGSSTQQTAGLTFIRMGDT